MFSFLVTLWVAFQVHAAIPAHPSLAPVRAIFLGGEWSSGISLKPEETVAARFQHHLERFLNRKVEVRYATVTDISNLPGQVNTLLIENPADYVFYFCDSSSMPVTFASEQKAPWSSDKNSFKDYLSRQIGAIRLASTVRKSPLPADVLLQPYSDLIRRLSGVSIRFGAKFVLLWPGFPIVARSWDSQLPDQWPASMLSYLDVLKSRPRIPSERLLLHFRRNNVPIVTNLQISRYFTSLRNSEDVDPKIAIYSAEASDRVANMLATSVVALEF